jgi:hypothetical protein
LGRDRVTASRRLRDADSPGKTRCLVDLTRDEQDKTRCLLAETQYLVDLTRDAQERTPRLVAKTRCPVDVIRDEQEETRCPVDACGASVLRLNPRGCSNGYPGVCARPKVKNVTGDATAPSAR